MRKTIWKYPIPVEDDIILRMPAGAKPLTVQVQRGEPCLWCLVDEDREMMAHRFRLAGTGHELDNTPGDYVGSFQMQVVGETLVFHLFYLG